jgi:hypothetical protein
MRVDEGAHRLVADFQHVEEAERPQPRQQFDDVGLCRCARRGGGGRIGQDPGVGKEAPIEPLRSVTPPNSAWSTSSGSTSWARIR